MLYMVSPTSNTTRLVVSLSEDGYSDSNTLILYLNISSFVLTSNKSVRSDGHSLGYGNVRAYFGERGLLRNASGEFVGEGAVMVKWGRVGGGGTQAPSEDGRDGLLEDVRLVEGQRLKTEFEVVVKRNGWSITGWAIPEQDQTDSALPGLIIFLLSLTVLGSNFLVANKLLKQGDHFMFGNLCFTSIWMSGCYYVHFGAAFLGVAFNRTFSIYESIPCLLMGFAGIMSTSICCLVSMVACLHHYADPLRFGPDRPTSPHGKWFLAGIIIQVVVFLISSMLYNYRTPFLITTCILMWYPILHNVEAIKLGKRNSFNKWIHLVLWPLTLVFSWLIRGYGTQIISLKPYSWLFLLQLFLLLMGILVAYLQSRWSLVFFLPQSATPGIHTYRKKLGDLSQDEQDSECCICYSTIGQQDHSNLSILSVCDESQVTAGDLEESLVMKKGTESETQNISKCPCGHMFHEDCLEVWLLKKPVCPLCRVALHV